MPPAASPPVPPVPPLPSWTPELELLFALVEVALAGAATAEVEEESSSSLHATAMTALAQRTVPRKR
jgi:hypothetical protein